MEEVKKETEVKKEKPKKEKKEKNMFSRIMNIVIWVLVIGWMAICLIDFLNVHNEKDAMFCLKENVIEYEDGNVYACTGLGYKVYKYERDSFNAIEFGPFWIKDRSAEEQK